MCVCVCVCVCRVCVCVCVCVCVWVCTSTSPPIYVNIYMCVYISTQEPRFILVVSPRGTDFFVWSGPRRVKISQFRRGGRNHQLLTGRSTQHAVRLSPSQAGRAGPPRGGRGRHRPSSSGESSTSRLSGLSVWESRHNQLSS